MTPPPAGPSLGRLLEQRGLIWPGARAVRTSLHAADRSSDFGATADLVRAGVLPTYERMQDGRRLGRDTIVLGFAAEPGGCARLHGCRRMTARRTGTVPGDIVYDYDAAPLLHAFLSRARRPVFYDAVDEPGLDDLVGRLVLSWPRPLMRTIRAAHDPGLVVEAA